VVAGTLLGGLAGTLFGSVIVRRRGVYFAMCTIAFGQIFYYIAYSWNDFTGGFDGLRGFHREPIGFAPLSFDITGDTPFYYFALAIFAVAVTLMGFLIASPFGRTLRAIRENERRARFLGIPVEWHIWLSFSISCFFTALAGALYALLNNFADPLTLHYSLSGFFVIMAVLGGMRSFWGPLAGAVLFVVLRDFLSSWTVNWMAPLGLVFMLAVLFFPRGMLGILKRRGVE
jgi:branched-chain amino acid transport system permease protein